MKKILSILLVCMLLLGLTACGNKAENLPENPDTTVSVNSSEDSSENLTESIEESTPEILKTEGNLIYYKYYDNNKVRPREYYTAFKTLSLSLDNAYGEYDISTSLSVESPSDCNITSRLYLDKIDTVSGTKLFDNISGFNASDDRYSGTYHFVEGLVLTEPWIYIKPQDTSKQGNGTPDTVSIDYVDSKISATVEKYTRMRFTYASGLYVENQNGYFSFTFENTDANDDVFPFESNLKSITVSGECNYATAAMSVHFAEDSIRIQSHDYTQKNGFENVKVVVETSKGEILVKEEEDIIPHLHMSAFYEDATNHPYIVGGVW